MVILIGGVSCSGKTLMAQKLLEKYRIPYLSIDHIKMGLIRGNKYCDFTVEDGDDVLTEKLWPIVKGIIMTNIENSQHIIIEGCYLPPDRVTGFEPEYQKQIIPLYIGFSKHYIEKNFISGIVGHRSEIEDRGYDSYINPEFCIREHAKQKALCEENNVMFFEINEDYNQEIKTAYEWIDSRVQYFK